MLRRVWEAIETRTEEVWLAEAKRRRGKRESREKREEWEMKREKGRKTVEIKRIVEEWEIWDEEEEAARLEEEVRKLVPKKFHQWIKVFSKKQSERMLTRKI